MGPESTINIDSKYVIPYNTSIGGLGTDPLDPSNLISTRTQPNMVGGKRQKRRSNKKSSKIKSRKNYSIFGSSLRIISKLAIKIAL
jgi:hypothetical protein